MSLDLCLLADLKTRLKIPSTNTNADAELQALIDQCSTDFHNAVNRTNLFTQSYTERRDGQGGRTLVLRNSPIQSIVSLTVSNLVILQSPDGVQPGYVYEQAEQGQDISPTLKLVAYRFIPGYGNVLITYTAGFGTQANLTLGDPNFPDDIELAVLDWCELRYRQRPAAGMDSKRLATGESVTYDRREMPDSTKRVIEHYKRRVLMG
jgi:hypothetical protein